MTRRSLILAAGAAATLRAAPVRRTSMGLTPDSFPSRRFPSPADLIEFTARLGMGGCQIQMRNVEAAEAREIRKRAEDLGMYLVVSGPLPRDDVRQFETMVRSAKEAGALAIRLATGQRRYEQFTTLEQRKEHVARVRQGIEAAIPIAERARMPLAMENHKDWTLDEQLALHKQYSSEYFGACIDMGNNIAVLDDPMETIETLAPYAFTTHFKNMAVQEYEDGFLLSEVPLPDGILDMKRVVEIVRARRPKMHFSLEMITRDPLKIPCLTEQYWATFAERNGRYLARTLAMVRKNKSSKPLPRVTGLDKEAVQRLEMENVERSIAYARDALGLV